MLRKFARPQAETNWRRKVAPSRALVGEKWAFHRAENEVMIRGTCARVYSISPQNVRPFLAHHGDPAVFQAHRIRRLPRLRTK
jgi:hypothetical protein